MKTWQFVCTILTIFFTVGTSTLIFSYNQGKLVKEVEHTIGDVKDNTDGLKENTDALVKLKIEFINFTNELKLEKIKDGG